MAFQKATKKKTKLRLALCGVTGSGKTYSALEIAKHLGTHFAVIDTERGSASKYAGEVADFDVVELENFAPARYIAMLKEAAKAAYPVVVVDSLSHAWMGEGGILDQKDKKSGNDSFGAWRTLTPQHNDLVEAILSYPGHVIVTMRSKTEYVLEKNSQGKNVPRKVGMAPVQRDGLEYEFDVVGDMDFDHTLHVTKSRCAAIADQSIRKPGEQVAKALLAWLDQGVDEVPRKAAESKGNQTTAATTQTEAKAERGDQPSGSASSQDSSETSANSQNSKTTADGAATKPASVVPSAVLDLAEAITQVTDDAGLAWALQQIANVTSSERLAFALKRLVEQRGAQLDDSAWTADERAATAAKWLRAQLDARAPKTTTETTTAA